MALRFPLGALILVVAPGITSAAPPDPAALAARVDKHLATGWAGANTKPADTADDATFVRRVYLDLVGRIPTVAEARAFIEDKATDKRAKLIDKLVASGGYTRHAATFWRRIWIPQADTPQFARLADGFEEWLAARLAEDARYDAIVRELLVAPTAQRPRRGYRPEGGQAAQTFFTASESKPENLAANTARAFLGVNLDCAQCHDHPFAKWTREQFWETAAFFTPPVPAADGKPVRLELAIPGTKRSVTAAVLTGTPRTMPAELSPTSGSKVLADWVTEKDNPFFAKNAVNRLWADLFGTGLVEPLDDLGGENAPSHPELLDDLGRAFADSNYDLKYLTKALVLTKAYQLSSVAPAGRSSSSDAKLFARMPVRGLTGEQLYDSLRVASGLPVERDDLDPLNALRERKSFAAQFHTERAATAQRSIIQSLALMNGSTTRALTDPTKTPALAATADAPFLDTRGKVEALFLAALGRKPTERELAGFVKHVESGGSHKNASKALADVFWALLNSGEFNTNH
ncbi:hypothetical protein VT84_15060 [Gemmata sp. SH-PL17]|uniref:DUF1549 and DUF1553 domain-containing protein n=1 Tax=Gemmata sp. SH-PL17 TaxID=1630693 RepID=UPI0004B3DBB9|nr:DUF1549 and DUF1553 domain-containing protein [Gemmata sp. SH-PL17]AMV25715.1 hypothetical protein VT84_15060 [Gemmata sp. SH-PL17]